MLEQELEHYHTSSTIKQIVKATQEPRIKDLKPEQLSEAVIKFIEQANRRVSTSSNKDVLTQTYIDVLKELKQNYKALTLSEVSIAIESGSLGKYGEFYGVNSRSVVQWVRHYKENVRNEAMKVKSNIKLKLKEARKMEEAKQIMKKFHAEIVNFYNTGDIGMTPKFAVYKYLTENLGHDILPREKKLEIWEQAKEMRLKEFQREKEDAMKKGDRNGVTQLKALISDPPTDYLKSKAQELALAPLLEEMKKQKIELS